MHLLKIGAAVLNQTPLDWQRNQRNIAQAIAAARDEGVGILCLPELCITGYGCEDAFHSHDVHRIAQDVLGEHNLMYQHLILRQQRHRVPNHSQGGELGDPLRHVLYTIP